MASAVGTRGPGPYFSQIPVSCPNQVLFVGDSFVTRFPRYCTRETIINCGIRREFVNFSTLGAVGAGIPFVRDRAPQSAAVLADFFILQNGGNDLNHPPCDPDSLACSQFHCSQGCQARRNLPTLLPRYASGKKVGSPFPSSSSSPL